MASDRQDIITADFLKQLENLPRETRFQELLSAIERGSEPFGMDTSMVASYLFVWMEDLDDGTAILQTFRRALTGARAGSARNFQVLLETMRMLPVTEYRWNAFLALMKQHGAQVPALVLSTAYNVLVYYGQEASAQEIHAALNTVPHPLVFAERLIAHSSVRILTNHVIALLRWFAQANPPCLADLSHLCWNLATRQARITNEEVAEMIMLLHKLPPVDGKKECIRNLLMNYPAQVESTLLSPAAANLPVEDIIATVYKAVLSRGKAASKILDRAIEEQDRFGNQEVCAIIADAWTGAQMS